MQTTDYSEKGFQKIIVKELCEQGYIETFSKDFNKEFCFNLNELWQFIKTTQPKKFDFIQDKGERQFLLRLDKKIRQDGIVDTLRKGVKHYDKTIDLFYPQPPSVYNKKAQDLFDKNLFTVTQELMYTDANRNEIDLVVFLNGLPVVTMELKNAFTHQAVKNAIKQYRNTRDPKDLIFNFGRCMVHFAADTDLVYMATALANEKTFFLPFNKGLNDGDYVAPFGAGNPEVDEGIKTSYLWKDILERRSFTNIIGQFAQIVKDDDDPCNKKLGIKKKSSPKLIFPRYHQLKVVRDLLYDVKHQGIGKRYLIQHSAGSGKSNSITWLAHQLVGLYDKTNTNHLFDSVIVVTDRTVLDRQIRENIKRFAQVKSTVEAITGKSGSKTSQLKEALANKKKIIICTVQTFPFLLKEMDDLQESNFGIIIDEAHSSQSGDTAAKMNAALAGKGFDDLPKNEDGSIDTDDIVNHIIESRKMLKNASYFAFTATPKNKTLETFGIPYKDFGDDGLEKTKFKPFHTYSMKQAIEEEFILDVLANYTTYNSYYKLISQAKEHKEFEIKEANKKLRSYVEGHKFAITEKAKIMVNHFHQEVHHLINGKAKAMIVCKSIASAMKYKDAVDDYLKEIKSPYKSIVAFSGKNKHYSTGVEMTEAAMNNFADGDNDIPCKFRKDKYRFLIVANKYQTGFDQPLLHTMYVDKQLSSVAAVQTLSRLNRAHKPYKKDTFVLDFFNKLEDIKVAFQDYYTTTILSEETDINKLNDLQDNLTGYQVYSPETVIEHFTLYYNNVDRNKTEPLIKKGAYYFDSELTKDEKISFKSQAKSFVRTYSYLAKIVDVQNPEWEMLWLYLKYLTPLLKIDDENDDENIIEAINMDSYRVSRHQQGKIDLVAEPASIEPIPVSEGGFGAEKTFDTLESIINEFNKRFGDIEWTDNDKVNQRLSIEIPRRIRENEAQMAVFNNSDKSNARDYMNKIVTDVMKELIFSSKGDLVVDTEIYKTFADNADFKQKYVDLMFDMFWSKRNDGNRPQK